MKKQMKNRTKAFLIILCVLVLISSVVAAVFLFNSGNRDSGVQSHGISFREDSVTIEKFETYSLELVGAENNEIEWKSNNEEIATVQDGVVCGWKKGNTQILANIDGIEVSCNVFVTDNQYIPVIELGEPDAITMDIGGVYSVNPVLYYNGNAYTDVEYTFSGTGNAVTVDENGVITAAEVGEAFAIVQGKWRGNVVEATLAVKVIDASTSIEVSGKVFDIYLNGWDEEFPATADIGITIFDEDTRIEQKNASVQYTELIMKGDVAGAATIKNGVVYAQKLGTTHFIAEYISQSGEAVRSTLFAVNVHESPRDIYMKPVAGEEYESFITPLNPINSVEWDETLNAFHLTNLNDGEDDGRAFLFSRDYIENIIRYTGAKSIVFEVKGDGIRNGSAAANQVIYQGFYPDWYNSGNYEKIDNTSEWTEVEIFFDDIPLDKDGNRKSIMLLSTKEGMYIRNIRPMTEGLFLTMDVEITTTGGNWNKDIEIGAFPHSYQGSINGDCTRATVRAGVKTTVKFRLDDFLENGKIPGFGLVIFGGPEWDAKLPDGYTPDRHTLKISNLRVSGEQNYNLDLSTASWTSGKNGTGFTDANGSGTPTYEDGAIIITNGFRYDGHRFTLDSEEAKNRTYIYMDVEITTLGNSTDPVEVRFYPHGFDGSVHESFTDKIVVTAGQKSTIKLNLDNYLIDGQFPGIGFAIFGGPTWDAKLPDGVTPDRHTVTISNMHLVGKLEQTVDLSGASVVTGFGGSNSGGTAAVVDGAIVASGGFCYDGHMITFGEGADPEGTEPSVPESSYLCVDLLITTLGNSTDSVDVRFYPLGFEGNAHEEQTDKVVVTAGTKATVKLKLDDYLVDGKITGIGIAIFGGPTWDAKLPDGTPDRHTVIVSNVRLEGETEQTIDLSGATIATGFANTNSGGTAAVVDGTIVISNGFCYDGHMITFAANTEPEVTEPEVTEPEETEPDTYICLDMLITTLGNSTDSVEIGICPYDFNGDINNITDRVRITAGTAATVKVQADDYLVDGQLPGIGFVVYGGPTWDAKLPDGYTPDRHTLTISNVRLEGAVDQTIDLSNATVATGTNGTGFANANGSGVATIGETIVITNGFRFDGHKITFAVDTEPEVTEPEVTEPDTYICLDMLIDTLGGNWTDDIEIGFFSYDFEGDINNWKEKVTVTAGTQVTAWLKLDDYLVNGKLPGIGIVIYGGPEWNTQLSPGVYDRHTLTISDIRLEGAQPKTFDLSASTVASGKNGTGYTNANGSGAASVVDGTIVISNGFRYDGHKITLAEDTNTYISMDILITTLGNSTAPVDFRFYPHNFAGNVHAEYTDKVAVTAGIKTTVRLTADKYLVDGNLPGIGIAIFGGPEWNTQLSPGVYDRHTVTISNVRLEGAVEQTIDLNRATCAAGFGGSNSGGTASVVDGAIVMANGFCYDGHMITFGGQGSRCITQQLVWLPPEPPLKKES